MVLTAPACEVYLMLILLKHITTTHKMHLVQSAIPGNVQHDMDGQFIFLVTKKENRKVTNYTLGVPNDIGNFWSEVNVFPVVIGIKDVLFLHGCSGEKYINLKNYVRFFPAWWSLEFLVEGYIFLPLWITVFVSNMGWFGSW